VTIDVDEINREQAATLLSVNARRHIEETRTEDAVLMLHSMHQQYFLQAQGYAVEFPLFGGGETPFDCPANQPSPTIPLKAYSTRYPVSSSIFVLTPTDRLFSYLQTPVEIAVCAICYMNRMATNAFCRVRFTERNVHRLMFIRFIHRKTLFSSCSTPSVLLASKYHLDRPHSNAFMSKVGGISKEETCRLEMLLLRQLSFELYTSLAEWESTYKTCFNDMLSSYESYT
jgi:hypothetical protein